MVNSVAVAVKNNVILTGIPRSGTTLSCRLLSQIPNVIALIEPMDISELMRQEGARERRCYIEQYFEQIRTMVREKGKVPSKEIVGESTNTFSANPNGKRKSAIAKDGLVSPVGELATDFTLVIKHPNAFSALLVELNEYFSCFAVIRNPLSVMSSWNSLDHPLNRGHAPMAEEFDDRLQERLDGIESDLDRQLALLDWYYRRYGEVLENYQIIRYEDIVSSNGKALAVIDIGATMLESMLTNRNDNELYNCEFVELASKRLLKDVEHHCWRYYRQDDVITLWEKLRKREGT